MCCQSCIHKNLKSFFNGGHRGKATGRIILLTQQNYYELASSIAKERRRKYLISSVAWLFAPGVWTARINSLPSCHYADAGLGFQETLFYSMPTLDHGFPNAKWNQVQREPM